LTFGVSSPIARSIHLPDKGTDCILVTALARKSICILSLSTIADDPRVRRQGQAFHDAGWEVTAVGIGIARSPAPEWRIIQADAAAPAAVDGETAPAPPRLYREGIKSKLVRVSRKLLPERHFLLLRRSVRAALEVFRASRAAIRSVFALLAARNRATQRDSASDHDAGGMGKSPVETLAPLPPPMDADKAERDYLGVFEIYRMYEAARGVKADLYLANDWHMLPVARALAKERDARFSYDTHEYAVEEYRYRPDFLTTKVPMVRAIEARGLREAAVVTAVSAGIAKDMAALHEVERVPVEIRNVPNRVTDLSPPAPTRKRMRVYFHGIITFDRGLEECIRSVPLWRPEFVFQMRGPIRPEFMSVLKAEIIKAGVWDRVEILPEVAMVDLVKAAAEADIGISTPPSTSKHNIYALPNKFFEYIQAGLAMCVADLPDMQRIMTQYELGVAIRAVTPEAIAEAVNSFTPELVDRYKANARKAAAELNWEVEQAKLVELYEQAL
jgi:glycosyltransferase involved in cell wall biosynthesis